jgi:hypothetical protein
MQMGWATGSYNITLSPSQKTNITAENTIKATMITFNYIHSKYVFEI